MKLKRKNKDNSTFYLTFAFRKTPKGLYQCYVPYLDEEGFGKTDIETMKDCLKSIEQK